MKICKVISNRVEGLPVLGKGKFGVVYKDGGMAIKVVKMKKKDLPGFLNEVTLLKRLNGTGVSPELYAYHICNGYAMIEMELIVGETLNDCCQTHSLDESLLSRLFSKLRTLHRNGIQHNDLHEDNVIIVLSAEGNDIRFIDFGEASDSRQEEDTYN